MAHLIVLLIVFLSKTENNYNSNNISYFLRTMLYNCKHSVGSKTLTKVIFKSTIAPSVIRLLWRIICWKKIQYNKAKIKQQFSRKKKTNKKKQYYICIMITSQDKLVSLCDGVIRWANVGVRRGTLWFWVSSC